MSRAEFRDLLAAAGLGRSEAARRLGVGRSTVHRWLNGPTPIARANAALIRKLIRPKKS